ncbi:ogr/Delta-like zinc finger family protein [Yersinia pekkanenii]|uniref:Transcriptional activator Ogr/delta n=1 Tax=Yersinia pekkanenii TaxID=1288385 RepID=A0A0T9R6U7_9GAMM|nr:transcriptional activator Ogr/delta [Yersinia pekkanenii]CRY65731.1 transcriptional activator Ogr/delta [Yersinia pekkanenii]
MGKPAVICPLCGAAMHNRKTVWQSVEFANLYYACTNNQCDERHVYIFSRLKTITPSGLGGDHLVKAIIERLRPTERKGVLSLLQNLPE